MKINWKVRLKNPVFWLTAIPSIVAVVYTILGLFGVVPTVTEDTILNAVTAIITVLSAVGVLVDPTTKGVQDSDRAMTYDEPSDGSVG
ncbi:MAG: phage holin [Faecalibacterium sp.]|nr:phage holin [Ruminococcus sp.]MCM1485374.1 phage holin [Faecalibacterium sp.]